MAYVLGSGTINLISAARAAFPCSRHHTNMLQRRQRSEQQWAQVYANANVAPYRAVQWWAQRARRKGPGAKGARVSRLHGGEANIRDLFSKFRQSVRRRVHRHVSVGRSLLRPFVRPRRGSRTAETGQVPALSSLEVAVLYGRWQCGVSGPAAQLMACRRQVRQGAR